MTKRALTYGDLLPQLLAHHLWPPFDPEAPAQADTVVVPPLRGAIGSFEVITKFTADCITQEVCDHARFGAADVAIHIIHLRDAHVIAALKALGWTPPPEPTA